MGEWRERAALNNAHWCDIVSRAHGARCAFTVDAWISSTRTPPLYPDAVTLRPDVSRSALLSRLDTSPEYSVKDSFACLDLSSCGFSVLFDAQWLVMGQTGGPVSEPDLHWQLVSDGAQLQRWEDAWRRGPEPEANRVFPESLLLRDHVVFVAGVQRGVILAGAVLNCSDGLVGLSNYFESGPVAGRAWGGCAAMIRAQFPGMSLVSYERDSLLAAARRRGFDTAGRLRVWTNSPEGRPGSGM